MDAIKIVLALGFAVAGLIGSIIIWIEAFRDEIWKGILCLLCGFYMLYYMLFDFEHDNKWLVVLLSLGGSSIAAGILRL